MNTLYEHAVASRQDMKTAHFREIIATRDTIHDLQLRTHVVVCDVTVSTRLRRIRKQIALKIRPFNIADK